MPKDLQIAEKKFRPELEGIRALAAFLVAIYHIWLGSVSGGVDVFFIVSGYLITTSLVTKLTLEGKIDYSNYLLGLGRRLIPLAGTVILTVVIFSLLIIPHTRWEQIIPEVFASMFYVQNWQLAYNTVDYLAQNNGASPLQHFWALSLQGQFYLIWPFLLTLIFILGQKLVKKPFRKTLLTVLIILFSASLFYSILKTSLNQPWAYFDTFARIWEFSLGGILALLIPYLSLNKYLSFIIGWLGILIIIFTGILVPVSDLFPGYVALLPISGVIFVIVSAENGSNFGAHRVLGSKPFLFLGSISYGFYLWHWPILIFIMTYNQKDQVSIAEGLVIVFSAFVLSLLTTKLVEKPIRLISIKEYKKKLVTILSIFILPTIIVGISWFVYFNYYLLNENTDVIPAYKAIDVIEENQPILENEDIVGSNLLQATKDLPEFYESTDCYTKMEESEVKVCSKGETESPDYTVALIGGSHAGHWYPALKELSSSLNFKIDIYNKDGCRFTTDSFGGKLSDSCMKWNSEVLDPLLESKPDVIFTNANVSRGDTIPEGYLGMWKKIDKTIEILAIRDNPWMDENIPECLEEKGVNDCSVARKDALSQVEPWQNANDIPKNVTFVDLSDYFCDEERCYPVNEDILIYRDRHHLTATYARILAEPLKEHLIKAFDRSEEISD